jgi:hypothetical protein
VEEWEAEVEWVVEVVAVVEEEDVVAVVKRF